MDLRTVAAEWRTPATADPGITLDRLITAEGEPWQPGERAYDRETGRMCQTGLTQQAEHWPTPMAGTPAQNGNNAAGSSDFSLKAMELAEAMRVWATPQARDHFPAHTPERIAAMKALGHGMRNLNDEAASWATPRAEDSESAGMRHGRGVADTLTAQTSSWATPVANQHKGSSPGSVTRADGKSRMDILHYQAEQGFPFSLPAPPIPAGATSSPPSRRLNPRFVEWLMGWPIGWTDCESAETGLSRWLLHSRGVLSTLVSPPPSAVDQGSLF
jgi:hypothetical protein